MAINERIKVYLEFVSKNFVNPIAQATEKMNEFTKKTRDSSRAMIDVANKQTVATKTVMKATDSNVGFFQVMRANLDQFKLMGKTQGMVNTRMGKFAFTARRAAHGMRGFRIEMLGVMFFGMSMNRMFTGLIKTSLEWFGVFEIMSLGLGLLFMPLAQKLLEWSIKFLKWVTALTPAQKRFWNQLVVVGIVIGTVLTIIGTMVLGLGSLALAFGFIFTPIGLVITALLALGGLAFLSKMFGNFGSALGLAEGKLIAFGVSSEAITMIKDKVRGALDSLKEMVPEFLETGLEIAKKLIEGIAQYFADNPLIVVGAIIGALLGGPAGAAIGSAIGSLFSHIDYEKMDELIDSGLAMLQTILDGMLANSDQIEEVLVQVMGKIGEWIGKNIIKLEELGTKIGRAILKGMGKAIVTGIFSFLDQISNYGSGGNNFSLPSAPSDGTLTHQNDFIWRPGQGSVSINPNDTLVGFKGAPPNLGGGGSGGGSVTNNFYGFTMEELKRELDSRDRQMVSQMEANR